MKQALLLIPALCLAACAAQNRTLTDSSPPAMEQATRDGTLSDPNKIREPSRVHTYVVNDYIDPNNPHLRHRGHPVDVVEQDEKWNLNPTGSTDGNYGPVTTASDPNAAPNPYSAEFETELAQQRDQFHQLVDLGSRMTTEMGKLQDMAEKEADAVSENASFHNRLDGLQQEIDELKTPPPPPIPASTPKKRSVLEWLWNWFWPVPQGKPVVEEKPAFHTSAELRPESLPSTTGLPSTNLPSAGPEVSTTPPVAQTNAPEPTPSEPPVPPPGELSHRDDNSLPKP